MKSIVNILNEGLLNKYLTENDDTSEVYIDNEEELKEALNSLISKLNEAEMSDEDKADTELIKSIYNKIDGKKFNIKNLTPEEQAVLNKYGIDAWGYKGDSKVVTPGRRDIIDRSDIRTDWYGRVHPDSKINKINYADRARKVDNREYALKVNSRKWYKSDTFDTAEKEMLNNAISARTREMKGYLADRKRAQNELDNLDANFDDKMNTADADYEKSVTKAANHLANSNRYSQTAAEKDKRIKAILDKHRKKIESLIEAISPEDEHDNELIRSAYDKILHRHNARLTPDEEAVLNKYHLDRDFDLKTDSGYERIFSAQDENPSKVNYADRARKIPGREYARHIRRNHPWTKSFDKAETDEINKLISGDYRDMRYQLSDRNHYNRMALNERDAYKADVEKASINRDQRKQDLLKWKDDARANNERRLAQAQSSINRMLAKEALNEEHSEDKRTVRTGLSGNINHDILLAVIGQMSDGMWENSPGMTGYWYPVSIDASNNIVIDNVRDFHYYDNKYIKNPYYDMSDAEVKKFFANKIKAIAQQWLHDNNFNPYKNWNADCTELCTYLNYKEDVTIADAYNTFNLLRR